MEKTAPSLQVYLQAETLEGNFIRSRSGETTINPRVEDTIGIDGIDIFICKKPWFISKIVKFQSRPITAQPVSEIASLHDKLIEVCTNQLTRSPVTVNKSSAKQTAFHNGILQIAPNQFWHLAEQPFAVGEIAVDELVANGEIGNFVTFKKNVIKHGLVTLKTNVIKNSSREIDPFQVNSKPTTHNYVRQDDITKVSLSLLVTFEQF